MFKTTGMFLGLGSLSVAALSFSLATSDDDAAVSAAPAPSDAAATALVRPAPILDGETENLPPKLNERNQNAGSSSPVKVNPANSGGDTDSTPRSGGGGGAGGGNGVGSGHGNSGPCQDLNGAAFGLCTAFCEAQECQLQDPWSTSCQVLYDNYMTQTGEEPPCLDPCFVPDSQKVDHDVTIMLTADDSFDLYVDGVDVTSDATYPNNWFQKDTLTYTLESGCHTLAVAAKDQFSVISGFIASVSVDGVVTTNTGDGEWLVSDVNPGPGWTLNGFDDSSMYTEQPCNSQSVWGTYWPAPFYAVGASWVWGNTACGNLGEAFFRLNLELD